MSARAASLCTNAPTEELLQGQNLLSQPHAGRTRQARLVRTPTEQRQHTWGARRCPPEDCQICGDRPTMEPFSARATRISCSIPLSEVDSCQVCD